MLTTHIKEIFLVFSRFCKFLFMFSYANFYGFSRFCKFLWVSCKVMKAVKINDTSYLSWGSSPKLASGSLRLLGVETRPAAVCPPLLLSLQLQLLHVVESLASDAAVLGMSRYVGVAFLVRCRPEPAAHLAAG